MAQLQWIFQPADLNCPALLALQQEHLADMYAQSPADSVHALNMAAFAKPNIKLWTLWQQTTDDQANPELVGCVALKRLDEAIDGPGLCAELKSMRVAKKHQGKGYGLILLQQVLAAARQLQYRRILLETGSADFFLPARSLYQQHGFVYCGPFADYQLDEHSVFMQLDLVAN